MDKLKEWLKIQEKNLSSRDYELIKKATKILTDNICEGDCFPWFPYKCIRPFGGNDKTSGGTGIWNWDSAFHTIGTLHWDTNLAKEQILGFIEYQLENGMFIDVKKISGEINDISSKPPVLAWAAAEVYKKEQNKDFLERVYPKFVKNEAFWVNNRFYNNLFHYGADINKVSFEQFDLYVRWESGWDDSVRWDKPCSDYWPIDLNCYAIMMYRGLKVMAEALGKHTDYLVFDTKEKALIENINKYLWNDELKAYVDTNRFTEKPSDILTPASFTPLYIGVSTQNRAEFMAQIAKDKTKFYPGMPTVSYDNPEYSQKYWRGNTWVNVAYFAAKGLKNYGYNEIADGIKETILTWVENDGDCIHENYNSTTGEGLFCPKFSWSSVFVIEFILDF